MSWATYCRGLLLAGAVFATSAQAQWLPQGNPVCRVPAGLGSVIGLSRVSCTTQCGASFDLFWSDGRDGFHSIYRGRLSDFGSPPAGPGDVPAELVRQINGFIFPIAAIVVPQLQPSGAQFSSTATLLVWNEDPSSNQSSIRVQRFDDFVDWGPDGVAVVSGAIAAQTNAAAVAPDDSGGVIVAWTALDPRTHNPQAWVQRIDALGQLRFGADGIFLGPDTTRHGTVTLASDGAQGCYVTRQSRDSTSLIYQPVYVNATYHFDGNGQTVAGWPSSGIRMTGQVISRLVGCPYTMSYPGPNPPPPPAGVWLIREGLEPISNGSYSPAVRVSWIAADGSIPPAWAGPGLTVVSGRDGDVYLSKAVRGPQSDLYLLTQVLTRLPVISPTLEDLVLQRVSIAGGLAAGWPAAGVTVCDAPGRQSQADMTPVVDGVMCAWKDERAGNGDIYSSRILGGGARTAEWPVNGLRVCDALGMQYAPVMGPNLVGGAFIAWLDQRDFATHSDDLYGQTVSGDARLSIEPREVLRFAVSGARPNPARGAVQLRLELPAESDVALEVFDVSGRRVHHAVRHAGPGASTLDWDLVMDSAERARPGLYLMRVRAGTQEAHARVVVTK